MLNEAASLNGGSSTFSKNKHASHQAMEMDKQSSLDRNKHHSGVSISGFEFHGGNGRDMDNATPLRHHHESNVVIDEEANDNYSV